MSFTGRKRKRLWEENPICFVCSRPIDDYVDCTIEHKVPRSMGGTSCNENLAISHQWCNGMRGDLLHRHLWEEKLARKFNRYAKFVLKINQT